VPGVEFDVTPPTVSGAVAKTVRAPRRVKTARVRCNVTAQDDLDGSLPMTRRPRSGSRFKLGKTRVTCSATDKSANTSAAKFIVAGSCRAYTVRNATVGGIRDARTAGNSPAKAPIRMAEAMPPVHASAGMTTAQFFVLA
jgi:hypothetical protein